LQTRLQSAPARESRQPAGSARGACDCGTEGAHVLLYAHFDGSRWIPENWSQADPYRPVVKKRDAQAKWQEVGRERLQASPLDPELRVFARSASDDKAPIMMILTAVDVLPRAAESPAINLKVLLDPEEEYELAESRRHDRARPRGLLPPTRS
jgi:acetylornithine deacetylase/succinyl-diaminopimelate desuccinylase-like protein